MTNPNEFDFLASDAAALGLSGSLPAVRRVAADTPAGVISGLSWGEGPMEGTFLHGAGQNAHTWDSTLLARGRPALAIDLPGHGDSSWRDDVDYSPETNAAAVANALAALAEGPQLLVGHSLGGLTAAVVAGRRPDLVRALVMVDAVPSVGAAPSAPRQARDFLAGPKDFASRDEIVERALSFGYGARRAAVERGVFLNTTVRADGRVVYKHHLGNLAADAVFGGDSSSVWDALELVRVPVLLVVAGRGTLSPAQLAEFVARVPGATTNSVDSGHNVQQDRPALLAGLVSDFAARQP